MAMKYDLSNQYINEYTEMNTLFLLGSSRTTTGSGNWTSSSSGVIYSYTAGQQDLYLQLKTVLVDYLITANDWNTFSDSVDEAVAEVNTQINGGLFTIALGGLLYV